MLKQISILFLAINVTGCSTVQKYWPRDHDPVMFDSLVSISISIEEIDCSNPNWTPAQNKTKQLARYTEWRNDPQKENMHGLYLHIERMSKGGSKTFCEFGKKTAAQRIEAARSAWKGR